MDGQIHQVFPVVERHDLHVFRQDLLVNILYLGFQRVDDFSRILAFPHDNDTLHDIVFGHTPHLSQTGQACLMHLGQMPDQHGGAVDIFHHDVTQFFHVVNQPDTPHDIRLRTFRNDIAAHIDIAIGYRLIQLQRRNPVVFQLMGIDAYFECFHLAAEAHDVRHTGDGPQVTLYHPILQSLQFAHVPLLAAQRITENLPRRTVKRLYLRCHPVRQVCIIQQVVHLLACHEIVHVIFKHHMEDRKPEKRSGTYIRFVLYRIHGDFDRNRDEFLHFFGTSPRPLGNYRHLGIGHVRERIDRGMLE